MSLEYKVLGQDVATELFVDKKFVAVTYNSTTTAYSTDGISWTQTIMPASAGWNSVTYGDGRFVAVASYSTTAAYSTDGITWTATTMLASNFWPSVTYGDNKFLAVSGGMYPNFSSTDAAYSTDGITWTQATLPANAGWRSVTYGNGKFVAVAPNTTIAAYSTDGITWIQTTLPGSDFIFWQSLAYGDDKFLALAAGNSTAAYSTDGITWTQTTLPTAGSWIAVYGKDRFVAVAPYYTAAYSTNAITWTQTTITEGNWSSVTYGNDRFVAVAGGFFGTSDTAAYSTDGITWTQTTLPTAGSWISATHGETATPSENNQYTVPSTKEAIISSIYIANNSSTSQTYSVAVVPDGQTLSKKHYIVKDSIIDGSDFNIIKSKITLSQGDTIVTEGSSESISVNILGVEK